jgi:hypothetical protein
LINYKNSESCESQGMKLVSVFLTTGGDDEIKNSETAWRCTAV